MDPSIRNEEITVYGHRVCFRTAGEGPVVVLVHGITGSSAHWAPVMPLLAERFTVVAPDLLGHGESAKPRGDYSLGAYATGVRDLLIALDHPKATIVGHSLGGCFALPRCPARSSCCRCCRPGACAPSSPLSAGCSTSCTCTPATTWPSSPG